MRLEDEAHGWTDRKEDTCWDLGSKNCCITDRDIHSNNLPIIVYTILEKHALRV